jgi:hypothetical protein
VIVKPIPDVSNLATSATVPCSYAGATVTVTSPDLATGTYTVNYTLTGANTGTANASMSFTAGSPGTGNFTTILLPSTGSTTITINSIAFTTPTTCASLTPPSGNTATIIVTAGSTTTWTGNVSTDWFDCGNWTTGVPNANTIATIPTTTTNKCTILDNTLGSAHVKKIIYSGGAPTSPNLIINTGSSAKLLINQ